MNKFDYEEPYIYRDEDNKKWCVRYTIKYKDENITKYPKEYGKSYFGKSLNLIKDLTLREKEFQKLLLLVEMDLKAGIDLKRPETVKEAIEKEIKEAKKCSYDENFKLYMILKGYENPIPKKEGSAQAIKTFHKNQIRPFLEKKGLLNDMNLIKKSDMLEFMNYYYLNDNPEIKWSNNTFNSKKGLMSSFFQTMVDEEIMLENPVTRIKYKEPDSTERFEVFSNKERKILFDYLDTEGKPFIATIARIIYYAYIRESEVTRLKVSDFDLEKRTIRIEADKAKGQKDKLVRWVKIAPPLNEALKRYLSLYEHQPNWYMFGKKYRPSTSKLGNHWQYLFLDRFKELKITYPKLFTKEGLSLYSLKHTGVTDFVNENVNTYSTTTLLRIIQLQCRHETLEMTQRYLKKLEINLEEFDEFVFH